MGILPAASGGFLRRLRQQLLDGLLPQCCLLCAEASAGAALCSGCRARLPRLPQPACPVCAHSHVSPADSGLPCGRCLAEPPAFDASGALYAYLHPVDVLVQQLKYRHRLASAEWLGQALCAEWPRLLPAGPAPVTCLLPMPLAPQRLAERGFNQALELARPLAAALALPLLRHAVTRRPTRAQAALHWDERPANVRRAFTARQRFDDAHVLVIDDVMTTGATLDALARELKRQGAARVSNLVLARTLRQQ